MVKILVTGGTRGIGRAISCKMLEKKPDGIAHHVLATYVHNKQQADVFARETKQPVLQWDVADFAHYAAKQAEAEALLVGETPDILVHNAGIVRDALLHKMTPAMWHDVINTNLSSAFYLCQWVLAGMRAKKWGRIVLLGSLNGVAGQRGQTNYAAAKAGLVGFAKALAREVARDGITVNVVAPGYTDTDMVAGVPEVIRESIHKQIPLGRFLRAEEVAASVAYLCSQEAAGVTGTTLHINGGHWMG